MATAVAQQRSCFIITPFDGFDDLTKAIKLAAENPLVGMPAFRNDDLALGLSFPDTIFDQIQAAALVVAVCSPEPKTSQPNRNVLIELGLAMALRKPILILTTDPETLPSDIRHITWLKYSPAELAANGGIEKTLTLEMAKIAKARPAPPPTGKKTVQQIVVNNDFWKCFRLVVRSTQEAIKALTSFEATVSELLERSLDLLRGHDAITFVESFTRLQRLNRGTTAIEYLNACSDKWETHYDKLSRAVKVMTHFRAVQSQVGAFPSLCHEALDASTLLVESSKDERCRNRVYTGLLRLRDAIEALNDELHNLLFSMLEEIP